MTLKYSNCCISKLFFISGALLAGYTVIPNQINPVISGSKINHWNQLEMSKVSDKAKKQWVRKYFLCCLHITYGWQLQLACSFPELNRSYRQFLFFYTVTSCSHFVFPHGPSHKNIFRDKSVYGFFFVM